MSGPIPKPNKASAKPKPAKTGPTKTARSGVNQDQIPFRPIPEKLVIRTTLPPDANAAGVAPDLVLQEQPTEGG